MSDNPRTVLVTGATGYIGGRLVPRLLEAGHTVKVLVRTPAKIAGVPWLDDVEVVQSSLDDGDALREALDGVDVLYYLVHSMAAGSGFESKEKAMAETAARAAADAGVDRIVYLGGLHPAGAELSTHMRSREAVGKVFLDSPVDAIVFQAGVVIGSGSASFEMIRHLSETLPADARPQLGAQQDRGDRRARRAALPRRRRQRSKARSTAPSTSAAARSSATPA